MKKKVTALAIGLTGLGVILMVSCSKDLVDPNPNVIQNTQENSQTPLATFNLSLSASATAAITVPLMNNLETGTDILMTPDLNTGVVVVTTTPTLGGAGVSCPASQADYCHNRADEWLDEGCSVSGHMDEDGSVHYFAKDCP